MFAWPGAQIAVMGALPAVRILHRRTLAAVPPEEVKDVEARLAAEHEQATGDLQRAVGLGVIDEIVEPDHTRQALTHALASADRRRGAHGNIPL